MCTNFAYIVRMRSGTCICKEATGMIMMIYGDIDLFVDTIAVFVNDVWLRAICVGWDGQPAGR